MESEFELPHPLGRYMLTRRLGRGGMGVVYAAHDERLGRDVAVKMIAGLSDEGAVKRFWREARAAASVSHPNVCQIYEVDESPDGIYLAMELLAGEPLDARLARGSCPPADALKIALDMLGALAALHERGIVHRDIKPSNVFLSTHGVKLLDFGLARPMSDETLKLDASASSGPITRPGTIVGTPRYMAPEQLSGDLVDGRSDLWAAASVLFEMLAGRPPFDGDNVFDLAHAVLNERPPALQGPPAVVAIDRVIRRALSKDPAARFPDAEAMATELRSVSLGDSRGDAVSTVRALLRLVVPPLRLLKDDADAAFLSYGLAEAVSGSLAGLHDVVVRSPAIAARWTGADADPRKLAAEMDVDVIVSGSLTRMGDQLRATLQIVEASSGTVLGASSVRGKMAEIFEFEDQLTQGVIGLLTPLRQGSGGQTLRRDVPANGRAFEFFLRGLELARTMTSIPEARTCFEQAIAADAAFAPAWAWLGRCHRVIGKYVENYVENDKRAEDAFQRALALSPDLPTAHRFFTHFESEHGRADAAVARLLQHSRANRNDAQLFAALVHACRYAGLNGASLAAHEEARRLDPTVPTSVEYTLLMAGELARLQSMPRTVDAMGAYIYLLLFSGHTEELRQLMTQVNLVQFPPGYRGMLEAVTSADSNPERTMATMLSAMAIGAEHDPEAVFLAGMAAAHLGDQEQALRLIGQSVQGGFSAVHPLERAPTLDALRNRPEFLPILETARQRRRIALAVFERGGGPALLGVTIDQA
jgi:TolB-like protein